MKKGIFAVLIGLFILIGVFGIPASTVAAEAVVAGGDADEHYLEYRIPWGSNLTWLARDFRTTKEELLMFNPPGESPCVKSPNLILAGCKLTMPVVPERVHLKEIGDAALEAYEQGIQEGKQAVEPVLVAGAVYSTGSIVIIAVLLAFLAKRNGKIAGLKEKLERASDALKEADADSQKLCGQIEELKKSNLQRGQRVQELVAEKNKPCINLDELGAANRQLNVRADELALENNQLKEDLHRTDRNYEPLTDRVKGFLTAVGLYELVQNMTVGELTAFLEKQTFGNERVKKPLRKLQEVIDDFIKEQKLSGADADALNSMTLKHLLDRMSRGRILEF